MPSTITVKDASGADVVVQTNDALAALLAPASATFRLLSATGSSQDENEIKTGAGAVMAVQAVNASLNTAYLKLYDKATGATSSDTPRKTIELPPQAQTVLTFPGGLAFASGIRMRLTAAIADNDTADVTAGDVRALNVDYR